jgi:hypothetical protein
VRCDWQTLPAIAYFAERLISTNLPLSADVPVSTPYPAITMATARMSMVAIPLVAAQEYQLLMRLRRVPARTASKPRSQE